MPSTFLRQRMLKAPSKPDPRLLRNDFQYFCEMVRHRSGFSNSPYPDFIHEIMWEMEQTMQPETYERDVLIEMPRGHGKTTIIVAPFIAWRLLREPSTRVAVFSAGKTRASIIATNAKKIITKIFPDQYELAAKPTATTLMLKHNLFMQSDPSLTSFPIHGMGSVGGRSDLIVPDDIFTTESADTEIKAAGVIEKFEDLPQLFDCKKYNQRVTVGTRQGYGDLYDRIHQDGTYKILRFPIVRPQDEDKLPPPPITTAQAGDVRKYCIWPSMMTDAKLIPAYNSPRVWNTQYMLRPPQAGHKAFLVQQIKMREGVPSIKKFSNVVISVDPAVGNLTGTLGDKFAMLVIGFDLNGDKEWHLINGWAKNDFDIKEVAQVWKNFLARYNNPITYVETNAQQAFILPTLREASPRARISGKASSLKKNFKITGFITPVITSNRLNVWPSDVREGFIYQLDRFDPQNKNNEDDIIDAFAMALERLYHLDRTLQLVAKDMGMDKS